MISDCNHQYQHGLATMTTPVTGPPQKQEGSVPFTHTHVHFPMCSEDSFFHTLKLYTLSVSHGLT